MFIYQRVDMPSVIYTGWWFQPTPLKNDGVSSSVGMMTFRTEWKNKKMFQTTNQNWPLKTNVARGHHRHSDGLDQHSSKPFWGFQYVSMPQGLGANPQIVNPETTWCLLVIDIIMFVDFRRLPSPSTSPYLVG